MPSFPLAIGAPELTVVLLLLFVIVIPVAAIAFSRSGEGLSQLGKGTFAIDREEKGARSDEPSGPGTGEREIEVRQLVEASNFRRRARGEVELDVQAEIDRLLGVEDDDATGDPPPQDPAGGGTGDELHADGLPDAGPGIREEIRQLVVANNERRARRGEDPLDVEDEVDRRMAEWT
ncbi:MAG: hypothetical protein M3Y23_03755 [Actinomycetota bacterium]|nr:hypothetical protein [Actinomycetota bacterium]